MDGIISDRFDILFEYAFGKNVLGFKSTYDGRISSFTGDG